MLNTFVVAYQVEVKREKLEGQLLHVSLYEIDRTIYRVFALEYFSPIYEV